MGDVILGIDFSAKRERDHAQFLIAMAISQALAPDECFMDETDDFLGPDLPMLPIGYFIAPEMSIEERVRRSIYHGAGLPYPKDSA